jgi:hypothetical protein
MVSDRVEKRTAGWSACRVASRLNVLAFFDALGLDVLAGLLVAGLLAVGLLFSQKIQGRRERRSELDLLRAQSVRLGKEVAIAAGYIAHLRDVAQALRRAQLDPAARIGERVRRDILEPIRGYIPTQAGEQIKVEWFRPDDEQRDLTICCAVGHDEDVVGRLRLRIGTGIAGSAFHDKTSISLGDMATDQRFQILDGGQNDGAIICTPILTGQEATGVLSVLSTRKDAFGALERSYIEALAACIAALEASERKPLPTDHTETGQ